MSICKSTPNVRLGALVVAVVAVSFIALLGHKLDQAGGQTPATAEAPLSEKEVGTEGNHTYIIVSDGSPEAVVLALDRFETMHPELIITGWNPLVDPYSRVRGLWIDHQPRKGGQISE